MTSYADYINFRDVAIGQDFRRNGEQFTRTDENEAKSLITGNIINFAPLAEVAVSESHKNKKATCHYCGLPANRTDVFGAPVCDDCR